MAPSSQAYRAPSSSSAQMATPDSPKGDSIQLLINAIQGVIRYAQSSAIEPVKTAGGGLPLDTSCDAGSQPVTVGQLTELVEFVLEAKRQPTPGFQVEPIGAEQAMHPPTPVSSSRRDQLPAGFERLQQLLLQLMQKQSIAEGIEHHRPTLSVDTSEAYMRGQHRAWDDRTEIDDCPQEGIRRFSRTGLRYVEAGITPDSPQMAPWEPVTREDLRQLLADMLDIIKSQSTRDGKECVPVGPNKDENTDQIGDKPKVCASKLEYRTVNEVWDPKEYKYKIFDSPPAQDVTELDEYIFVIRKHINKETSEVTYYVDVKSPGLRDLLRVVLKDIRTAGLETEKPAIERNLLYHFLHDLKDYRGRDSEKEVSADTMFHLDLLIEHLEEAYQSTSDQLSSLLSHGRITWDLLWALFKPGALVFMICPSTGLPRCVRYSSGEEKKTVRNGPCFVINSHYFDFDGEVFGESMETLQIESFRGAKQIENLPAYPLAYHSDNTIWPRLVSNGRKFVSLMGSYHRQYYGNMFVPHKNKLAKLHVNGKIMIDAGMFRKENPNYPRLETKRPDVIDMFGYTREESGAEDRVRSNGRNSSEMKEDDLALCSPTVLGFSLAEKIWGEFDVEKVADIRFSDSPFDMLTIPEDKKKVIKSLTESRVSTIDGTGFDDIITGKGQGVVICLHGPPGVGKTLTAEAMAERLQRPLYSVSSGDLSTDAERLEVQLTRTFRLASDWKAVLLLDEADVYLQRRDGLQLERNRLVATFLRTLEYYNGIFFLTTNMLENFDAAILDRIQLNLRYDDLGPSARRKVFKHFLKEVNACVEELDLDIFSKITLNGRQIKNIVKIAYNVALSENSRTCVNHLRTALTANGYSIPTQVALLSDDSLYDEPPVSSPQLNYPRAGDT